MQEGGSDGVADHIQDRESPLGGCGTLTSTQRLDHRLVSASRLGRTFQWGRLQLRRLSRLGWVVVAQRGSHVQLKHPNRGGRVTIPFHAGETIGPGLLRSILAQAGLTVDEFRAAL